MQLRTRFFVVALSLSAVTAEAGPNRTPVKGTPVILGREIPRFVTVQPICINRFAPGLTNADMLDRLVGQMLAGQFVPVSEDPQGVYYQAARGFQTEGSTSSIPAGLYVSKTRAGAITVYTGEARDQAAELLMDVQRLGQGDLAKLKIGTVGGKATQ